MTFDVITIFPRIFDSPLKESLIRKAIEKGLLRVRVRDLREYTSDKHRMTDDYPYGGGAGMVLKPEPIVRAIEEIKTESPGARTILLSPQGERFHQGLAKELSAAAHWILICGRYEGIDERIRLAVVDRDISIGDYVLNGGEIPALVIIEAVSRYLKGFLGSEASLRDESFSHGLLEYPQYTRPQVFRGMAVPEVLLSGNHAEIAKWRRREALRRTLRQRPDLLVKVELSAEDEIFLAEMTEKPIESC